ncbi:MAG: sugar ABC transporter ATP-binding protein [candidate division KSB1 bacterium]|nr:sugar ABC transporter ATP-binding protein [candidate division KSB1 bacterium]MDZ7276283.1 sugar ABC transporter ATP-binding protein [candidate division KSB1 bacterium]MDZ7287911.1 sugar ABC transporter ATP-binding protein [candidate division KSB1 bacterium]MDZ7300076.1 sugar ABC transporter ATP-binding protein [candidate division KSB1 bacterium]MDZ7308147.1 sugar ABC transporter ATP-binding protein [candidate division KSB1 bacterium]
MAELAPAAAPAGTGWLEMRGIHKRFGATVALAQVDFEVRAGEVHALVGENGAGKSTLMKILSGALQPEAGSMWLAGRPYHPRSPLQARQHGVGMIYQELSLAPHLTVAENILLGMEPARFGFIKRREVQQRALAALQHFDHPEIKPGVRVRELPPGARQLVEIARALAMGCTVLVFDEPTSSLSRSDIQSLFRVIRDLRRRGLAIVYISHFLEEVGEIADRLTVLRDGRVAGTRPTAEVTPAEIVALMVGRTVQELYPRSPRQRGEPVVEIRQLSGMQKPADVSLTLYRGEVLGICGLVGAGRTELLRALFGLDPIRRGEIKIGVYAGPASPLKRWQQGVGLLSEDRKEEGLALNLSLADNLTLSKLTGLGPLGLILPRHQAAVANHWIAEMDIHCRDARQRVADLSGGNQQKVALGRLLHHEVDILLLDEPTRGIDVAAKAKIYEVVDRLVAARHPKPRAVLMVSSYLPELLGICDRIAVMVRGKLGAPRPAAELDEHQLMLAATGQADSN